MIFPALTTLKAIQLAFEGLNLESDPDPGIAASAGAILSQLEILCVREQAGKAFILSQFRKMAEVLELFHAYTSEIPHLLNINEAAESLKAQMKSVLDAEKDLHVLEADWIRIRIEFEGLVSSLADYDRLNLSRFVHRVLREMIELEEVDPRSFTNVSGQSEELTGKRSNEINAGKLETYLKVRFSDDTLRVNEFNMLPGGFGKQTIMFQTTGRLLEGDFVLRRDMEVHLLENDCHMVRKEFPLLKAVFERGFTVPEPLLLETEHDFLPGGDFIIMRKAEGEALGNVFGTGGKTSDILNRCLAEKLATLHTMPPLIEVGELTESIRPDLWAMPLEKCVRHYISSWHSYFQSENPYPYPAIAGLFVWLLNNIPEIQAQPVLVHGDYAFNNFIIDQRTVTAVLDWELAHIGDPAEDLGYIRNNIRDSSAWDRFMEIYIENGGQSVDNERIRFFQIWGHVRNAAMSSVILSKYASQKVRDIKLAELTQYIRLFIRSAYDLIESSNDRNSLK